VKVARCDGCGADKTPSADGWISGSLLWTIPNPIGYTTHSPSVDFCSFFCAEQWARRKQLPPKKAAA
jgi:hypothetical protein